MYSPCTHHAYTQARDDDERVAAPEARPARPRQPRQRQLWAVGTCTSCSTVLAHHGVGQVLGGRELVLFVFQEIKHAGARARATRRRQAWASSEEQYCVACWDEHLGVGAEAAEVPPLHRVDTFGQSMTASAEAAARARTGAVAARTSRGRPAASVALAPPASAYPRSMPAEAEEAEVEVAEAMKRLEEAEAAAAAEAGVEAEAEAAAEAAAGGWVDLKAAAGWEALSCAGSEAATEYSQLSEHTEAWETDSLQLDLAEAGAAEAGATAEGGAEVPASAAALGSVTEGEACLSWAERARTPGTTTPLSVAAGRRAALVSVTAVAGQVNRRKAPWQLPKGVRAPPKRQLQRWGEVAFAFH